MYFPLCRRLVKTSLLSSLHESAASKATASGGWYGYRASKAALNQFVRTLAIELGRQRPKAVCVALHPGTVDTALSHPFQAGTKKVFSPAYSAERLLAVTNVLTAADSGQFFAWDGRPVPF
jgi:NAD(P)-dependent dehydrogenase (short-subunit alcohol dehydrogenase family)